MIICNNLQFKAEEVETNIDSNILQQDSIEAEEEHSGDD